MKKTIYLFASVILLLSCKKESSNPTTTTTTTTTNSTDTTKNTTVSNIDFSAVGTPIGKFGNGVTDIEGNKYKTVILGKQEWMAENLKVSKYSDGNPIEKISYNVSWSDTKTGAWCYYNNNDSLGEIYGKLYNWYTVNTRKVCPTGWHVPDDNELKTLLALFGIDTSNGSGGQDNYVDLFKEVGKKHWTYNDQATNTSLFTSLPSGGRSENGVFGVLGLKHLIWSSTKRDVNIGANSLMVSSLKNNNNDIDIEINNYLNTGMSIRCLKD